MFEVGAIGLETIYLSIGCIGLGISAILFPCAHTHAYYPTAGYRWVTKFGTLSGLVGFICLAIGVIAMYFQKRQLFWSANSWLIIVTLGGLVCRKSILKFLLEF